MGRSMAWGESREAFTQILHVNDDVDSSSSTYSVPITNIPSPLLYELSTIPEGGFGEFKISDVSYYLFVHFDVLSGVHIGPQAILSDFLT